MRILRRETKRSLAWWLDAAYLAIAGAVGGLVTIGMVSRTEPSEMAKGIALLVGAVVLVVGGRLVAELEMKIRKRRADGSSRYS